MNKRILSLVLTLCLVIAFPMSVFAEDYQGSSGWNVTFDGSKMNSTFTSADISDAVYKLLPGDTISITINLKNLGTQATDWYMENTILKSFEDSQKSASGGAYGYYLQYINAAGTSRLIYSSENVGGEGTTSSGDEGLKEVDSSLQNYLYLDNLASGASGSVNLKIKLDGETQGNGYQNTLAKLQLKFAVSPIVLTPKVVTTNTTVTNTVYKVQTLAVKTGDTSQPMLYISLAALAAGIIFLIAAVSVLRKKEDRKTSARNAGRKAADSKEGGRE